MRMIGGEQYEKRNTRGEGCGKDAPWKSPKADFSTSLGNPAKTRDSHFSHSLDCYWILFPWWTHWCRPKPAELAPFITGPNKPLGNGVQAVKSACSALQHLQNLPLGLWVAD